MAEGEPPLSAVQPPIHAMYRIVRDPPPTLSADAVGAPWSSQMQAFVASCLSKRATERPTASSLRHGAFCAAAQRDCLIELRDLRLVRAAS